MDCLDLLAVQGTLKSLLQHHSSKASILWRTAFLMVQLSHPYVTTGKTMALTIWTLVGTVMSLIFNMLHRFIGFPGGSDGEESTCSAGDLGSIPGLGRSPGGGHGNPLQQSCLENPKDRGAWWATVHGIAKSQTRLSNEAQHRFVIAFLPRSKRLLIS